MGAVVVGADWSGAAGGVAASGVAGGVAGIDWSAGGGVGAGGVSCAKAALLNAKADANRIIFIFVPPTVVGE
jgi:hypothetical protein